ncbi:cell wall-binding repeat-containing protein [Clostridium tyrobutyricum]|jgi:putative cell wall-binding protein|uniref:cell wall-binding repeat-containing protein n=1 Tax=Clostridium tyrobutyricum TaxID=1519 RepID=UPI001C386AFF|nr:cell wall-binding repeat-containing protein [Clostridium tyrobutyricum]MBV4440602.1 cell wall-binding repeat-containing protein [Clostridium tyrobutyricum]
MNKRKIIASFILSAVCASTVNFASTKTVSAATARLGGQDRYETSTKISQDGWTTSEYVVLASGQGYADALCAAPIASRHSAPILLTPSNNLDQNVKSEITRLKATHVIEIGGTGSISTNVENELKSMGLSVQRLGGADRYETSVKVAKALGTPNKVVVTSGQGYADALSIAPIAAKQGMEILLTSDMGIPDTVKDYIQDNQSSIVDTYVVGGTAVIPDSTISGLSNPIRISGDDRYETNVNVLDHFKASIDMNNVYIARGGGSAGNEFADALSASALAAKNNSSVVLTDDDINTNANTQKFIEDNVDSSANIVAVGGQASVADSVLEHMELTVIVKSANNRLQAIADSTSDSNEKDAVEQIIDNLNNSISNKLDNADEVLSDFQSNMEKTQQILQKLSDAERTNLQNKINADTTLMQYLDQLNQIAKEYFPTDTE